MLRRYLQIVPFRSRPAFFYETFYSLGRGVFLALWPLSLVVLKKGLDGQLWHLTVLGAVWGGSGLLAPWWAYLCRRFDLRRLVTWPNVLAGICFAGVALTRGPTAFMIVVAAAYLIGLPTRVAEMSVYRFVYPASHLARAVGWLKGLAFVAGAMTTLVGTLLIDVEGSWYLLLYVGCGLMLLAGAWSYRRIPLPAAGSYRSEQALAPHHAFTRALARVSADRRFMVYQAAFMASGFANHMSMILVAEFMSEGLDASVWAVSGVVAVVPRVLQALMAPFWGRILDRITPMTGRAIFSSFMMLAYGAFCFGGLTLQVWPFVLGAFLQGISQSGNQINWTTGSLYFARRDQVPLYNSVHVALTGLRGLVAPMVGAWLFVSAGLGPWVFAGSVLLAGIGLILMVYLTLTDTGPVLEPAPSEQSRAEAVAV